MAQLNALNHEIYGPYLPSEEAPLAVIGTGMVGASWAALFAAHGRKVHLYDSDSQKIATGIEYIHRYTQFLVDHAMADPGITQAGLQSISTFSELKTAVEGASLVQEAIVEDLEVKRAVFMEIDQYV